MEFISYDEQLFLYLNNLGSSEFDAFWVFISGKWSWVPLYAVLLYLLYKHFGLKKLGYIIIFLVLGVLVSDQVSGFFKYGFMRLRPCYDENFIPYMRIVECGGKYGFYSSHASNTFFLATFLSYLLKNKYAYFTGAIFAWASVVSYSRIYLGVHFPTDIAMGALMGSIIGGVLGKVYELKLKK